MNATERDGFLFKAKQNPLCGQLGLYSSAEHLLRKFFRDELLNRENRMDTLLIEAPADTIQTRVQVYATELIELVRARHPKAQFHGPTYWPDEGLWVIDAFFDQSEDFELREHLSERETDILLEEGIWLCLVPSPPGDNPQ